MTTLIERLKAERIAAMRGRRTLERDLLGTLIAAATKDAKEPDDAAVLRTVRSFLKANEETTAALRGAGKGSAAADAERALLEAHLPPAPDEAALTAEIAAIVAGLPERSPKAMGQVMAALKARHGEALNAKVTSTLVRRMLSP